VIERLLLFSDALWGTLIIAVACSTLGVFVVLRRIVFVGAALAQLSSAGIALALWLSGLGLLARGGPASLLLAFLATLGGVLFFSQETGRGPIPHDATIGVAYAVAAAAGILLIAKAAHGEAHDLFLQGNILGITRRDAWLLLALAVPVLALIAVFSKEFLFVSFDPDTASTLGYRVKRWNLLLYLVLGLVIAFAMQFAGVMLVFNFLVLPAVSALLLAHSMAATYVLSVGAALCASLAGFLISIIYDLPTAPAIIACSGVLTALAWIVSRLRPARS
jgi:ABC-type Mn2+/Zn2+ transport system permease subunit